MDQRNTILNHLIEYFHETDICEINTFTKIFSGIFLSADNKIFKHCAEEEPSENKLKFSVFTCQD